MVLNLIGSRLLLNIFKLSVNVFAILCHQGGIAFVFIKFAFPLAKRHLNFLLLKLFRNFLLYLNKILRLCIFEELLSWLSLLGWWLLLFDLLFRFLLYLLLIFGFDLKLRIPNHFHVIFVIVIFVIVWHIKYLYRILTGLVLNMDIIVMSWGIQLIVLWRFLWRAAWGRALWWCWFLGFLLDSCQVHFLWLWESFQQKWG